MPSDKKHPFKVFAPKLHIFCEGEETEPNYLRHYLKLKGEDRLTARGPVVIIEKREHNTPKELVEEIASKDFPDGDAIWAVYDREAVNKYPAETHAKARRVAKKANINIALSNVCFEVWLLLHREYSTRAYDSFEDLEKRSSLKKNFPEYKKRVCPNFSLAEINAARRNAVKMNAATIAASNNSAAAAPHQLNPYTNVHELLDAVDSFLQNM